QQLITQVERRLNEFQPSSLVLQASRVFRRCEINEPRQGASCKTQSQRETPAELGDLISMATYPWGDGQEQFARVSRRQGFQILREESGKSEMRSRGDQQYTARRRNERLHLRRTGSIVH